MKNSFKVITLLFLVTGLLIIILFKHSEYSYFYIEQKSFTNHIVLNNEFTLKRKKPKPTIPNKRPNLNENHYRRSPYPYKPYPPRKPDNSKRPSNNERKDKKPTNYYYSTPGLSIFLFGALLYYEPRFISKRQYLKFLRDKAIDSNILIYEYDYNIIKKYTTNDYKKELTTITIETMNKKLKKIKLVLVIKGPTNNKKLVKKSIYKLGKLFKKAGFRNVYLYANLL